MSDHYGEEWRHWPGGCKCHGDGAGYSFSYRDLFAGMFDEIDRIFLVVQPDPGGAWRWQYGAFSWTPDGDIWSCYGEGVNATRTRAEATCREGAENFVARVQELSQSTPS